MIPTLPFLFQENLLLIGNSLNAINEKTMKLKTITIKTKSWPSCFDQNQDESFSDRPYQQFLNVELPHLLQKKGRRYYGPQPSTWKQYSRVNDKGFNNDILHLSHPRKNDLHLGLEDGMWIKF